MVFSGGGASAATLFFDNFEAETITDPGNWSMNYAPFANFFVGAEGTVDLLGSPNDFGLPGDGKFVDLDGSSGTGSFLETIQQFNVGAGQLVTLSFSVAGNHREGSDGLYGGFRFFGGMPNYGGVSLVGFTSTQTSMDTSPLLTGVNPALAYDAPYSTYSISFRTRQDTQFTAVVGTNSADNIGPLIDNVLITSAAVPEPATWGLMILGFGTVGAMLRRRSAQVIA